MQTLEIVRPSSLAELHATVRDAVVTRTPMRFQGAGTWSTAGRPVEIRTCVSTRSLADVVEYVPGNLTITVGAGMTLRELDHMTREHGQWLPFDPFGTRDGTIGASVATASSGPLATSFGRIRDLVLGVTMITGRGDVISAGGRVVKNVAGYDIVRLATGAWGSLGVITEVSLRLYALPETYATVAIDMSRRGDLSGFLASFAALPVQPFAAELLSPAIAERLGVGRGETLLLRLGGNSAAVKAQMEAISALGGAELADTAGTWQHLRTDPDETRSSFRISALPSNFEETWRIGSRVAADTGGGYCVGSPIRGVTRVVLPAGKLHEGTTALVDPDEAARRIARPLSVPAAADLLRSLTSDRIRIVVERLDRDDWASLSPTVTNDRLSRGVKSAFDPHNVMNPGILGS